MHSKCLFSFWFLPFQQNQPIIVLMTSISASDTMCAMCNIEISHDSPYSYLLLLRSLLHKCGGICPKSRINQQYGEPFQMWFRSIYNVHVVTAIGTVLLLVLKLKLSVCLRSYCVCWYDDDVNTMWPTVAAWKHLSAPTFQHKSHFLMATTYHISVCTTRVVEVKMESQLRLTLLFISENLNTTMVPYIEWKRGSGTQREKEERRENKRNAWEHINIYSRHSFLQSFAEKYVNWKW